MGADGHPAGQSPLLRIAQLAAFFAQDEPVMDRAIECRTAEEVRRLFRPKLPTTGTPTTSPATPSGRELPKRIGRIKSDLLGINLVAVIQCTPTVPYNGNERLRDRASTLLERHSGRGEPLHAPLASLRPASGNAFESQALLQLATEYCDRRRCAECPVGRPAGKSAQTVRPRRRIPQPTLTL